MAAPTNPDPIQSFKKRAARAVGTKKTGGGTAAAGGTNFQAVVTAIAGAHLLRGTPLGWLDGIADDTPTGILAESEGPGDDLRIELFDGRTIEVQAKKGLTRGTALWEGLLSLAHALSADRLDFGILAVAPDSSAPIRRDLAKDIERLGQGREDNLTDIGAAWLTHMKSARLDPKKVCSRLRIRVVHGLAAEDADRRLAKEVLGSACADSHQADQAWKVLFEHAVGLMERRGRWDLPYLIRLLAANCVGLRENGHTAGIASKIANWVRDTNSDFSLAATRKRLPLSALLPMRTMKTPFELPEAESAEQALARYHDGSLGKARDDDEYGAEWTGRFRRRSVVQAGPGLGKSTLSKQLARNYASDGFPVLQVSLKSVAAAMANGEPFDHALKTLALDGSGVTIGEFDRARLSDLVVIADGLDDCGAQHEAVAAAIRAFATGHRRARIVVTTRPIGYSTAQLSEWQHYRLLGPDKSNGAINLANLLEAIANDLSEQDAYDLARRELARAKSSDAIKISPLTLGMAASLLHRRGHLPETRPKLYEQLVELFEAESDAVRPQGVSAQIAAHVLNALGWSVVESPLVARAALVDVCAGALAIALGRTKLAATTIVEAALGYWESVGLIETVHHDGTELLTFVHKSFAEFAAARHLIGMAEEDRNREVARIVSIPDWTEVTAFVSGLGHGDLIARAFLARGTSGDERQLERALAIVADPEAQVSDSLVHELVELAFRAIADDVPRKYEIGLAISKLAPERPEIVGPLAASRRDAENLPTSLAAWAASIKARTENFGPEALANALEKLRPQVRQRYSSAGLFVLRSYRDHELLSIVGLAALRAQPADSIEGLARRNFGHDAFRGTDVEAEAVAVFKERGLAYPFTVEPRSTSRDLFERFINPPEEERREHNRALRALAAAVALPDDAAETSPAYPPERFLQFAGYMSLSGFGQVMHEDLKTWSAPYDASAVSASMRAMVAVSELEASTLAVEAREVVRFLDADPTAKPYALHFPDVDIPQPDWGRAAALSLNQAELEVSLRHGSKWLAYVAGNLLEAVELAVEDVRRVLRDAQGASLWAGTEIALAKLSPAEAIDVLLEPIKAKLPRGAEYLFAGLRRLTPPVSDTLEAAIVTGLDGRFVAQVEQAAGLALDLVALGARIDAAAVKRAYADWQRHERTHEEKNVQWPSPLETLAKLLIALGEFDDETLAAALSDSRSDVRQVAQEEQQKRAAGQIAPD